MPLIIVESPTKSKTIKKFLDDTYEVVSSYGHIRDLPKSELGIDVEHNFEPKYLIPTKAKKNVAALKKAAQKEKEIILASDQDREGEAIAYHIMQLLKPSKETVLKRIVFHEITPEAIDEALLHPRDIDIKLVDAQKARRVLDRLVGYKLSPLLWKKILRGLSAGRVQSVALRLIAERELEREKFKAEEYWTIEADFDIKGNTVRAVLDAIDGKKLEKLAIKSESEAMNIKGNILTLSYHIEDIEQKEWLNHPQAPFITSTLQQTAATRLGFSASFTMSVAQKLYETGKITYMRTDSTTMAQNAIGQAAAYIQKVLGPSYSRPFQWSVKIKLAQEAHEAIRPTNVSATPESLSGTLDARRLKLYRLIWQRTLASQMTPARFEKTRIVINSQVTSPLYTFIANGSRLLFDGFTKIYSVKIEDRLLPDIQKNDPVSLNEVFDEQHFTQPPARYSEATLIKALKDYGIGRPSTYASIIEVIKKRNYVEKDENKKFFPTLIGRKVHELLATHFPNIVDIDFTARMEEDLDEIAQGKKDWVNVVREFYDPFAKQLAKKQEEIIKTDLSEKTDRLCPQCSAPVVKKLGRFGQFYSCSRYPECAWAEQIKQTIGITCPDCNQGDVITRKTKRGKLFYGCSRYPECKFASWKKPTRSHGK